MKGSTGFTLIELMVTLAVLVIVALIAVPGFTDLMQRQRLTGAGETLYSQLLLTRTEAIKRNESVFLTLDVDSSTDWCYGLSMSAACDCDETNTSEPDYCALDGNAQIINGQDFAGVTVSRAAGSYAIEAEAVRGTLTQLQIPLQLNGRTLQIETSLLGRVRMCTPAGTTGVGYKEC